MQEEYGEPTDTGLAESRRRTLETLASGKAGAEMAEMAKGVLAGHLSPRDVLLSGTYDEALASASSGFTAWYGELAEDDKEAVAERGRESLDSLAREVLLGKPSRSGGRDEHKSADVDRDEDDDEPPQSWLV